MNRLIYIQDAIDALMKRDKELRSLDWSKYSHADYECLGIDEALDIICGLPSAQPERKPGEAMSEKLKPCPFRIHGEKTMSLTISGEYTYNETFMPCMGSKCLCYRDEGDEIRCYRDNLSFTLLDRRLMR